MCKTFPYPLNHHSTECMGDGVGCDGYCIEHNEECNCECHSEFAPVFHDDDDVRDWHA